MAQGMRVTVDAAMRARDISRATPRPEATDRPPAPPAKPRKGEKRRLAKRRAARTT